jgi:Zn-dependent metalloprotease
MRYMLITSLSLALASGSLLGQGVHPPLPARELALRQAAAPAAAAAASRHLLAQRDRQGLGALAAFRMGATTLNTQGQFLVRAEQTHAGCRVWGASLAVRVNPGGATETTAGALEKPAGLAGEPRLTPADALRIAHLDLAPRGAYASDPTVERIVFPSRFTGGVKLTVDPKTHKPVFDRLNSVLAPRPSADYVWAYEVTSVLLNREDGSLEMHAIVDGNTGAILRKWNAVDSMNVRASLRDLPDAYAKATALEPRVASLSLARPRTGADTAGTIQGKGHSQYSGLVNLITTPNASGGFDLVDPTRGTGANISPMGFVGLSTFFEDESDWQTVTPYQGTFGDADNEWGDGENYTDPVNPGHPTDANGQTAAVDAAYGVTSTWDFYRNVLNRNGVDGQGGSIGAVVHKADVDDYGDVNRFDNAYWTPAYALMFYGDGTRTPSHPSGFLSLTEIDITGHEVSHGVAGYTANFDRTGESYGLNEGNSDIFGTMVEAYSTRPAGQDAVVPEGGTDWEMGAKTGAGTALRFMKKPSRDGYSPDAWYWGMGLLDQHYSCGALTRAFYFLAQGASATAGDETFSAYLPGGMNGVGNDTATRIWYKALSEYLTHDSGYQDLLDADGGVLALGARSAALKAATDLYGADSKEAAAVENAFAGINVGSAHGQGPRTMVVPLKVNTVGPATTDSFYVPTGPYLQYVAGGETVALKAQVLNNVDTSLTWKLGGDAGLPDPYTGGVVETDGTWRVPNRSGNAYLRAFSAADPLQWGEMQFYVANLDADDDVDVDAVDMGILAMNWGLGYVLRPSATVYDSWHVTDLDVYIFGEAFKAAFVK